MDERAIHSLYEIQSEYQDVLKAEMQILNARSLISGQQEVMCKFLTLGDLVPFIDVCNGFEDMDKFIGKHGFAIIDGELNTAIIKSIATTIGRVTITFDSLILGKKDFDCKDVHLLSAEL